MLGYALFLGSSFAMTDHEIEVMECFARIREGHFLFSLSHYLNALSADILKSASVIGLCSQMRQWPKHGALSP